MEGSAEYTVMVAFPIDTAVTFPLWSTVATDSSEEDQVRPLYVAFSGSVAADKVSEVPIISESVSGIVMLDTGMTAPSTGRPGAA